MEKKLALLQFHTATKIVLDAANVLHKTAEAKDKNVNLKTAGQEGEVNLTKPPFPSCGFAKNVSSEERVKPSLFVTFNIIIRHVFPENFIEIIQVVQKL